MQQHRPNFLPLILALLTLLAGGSANLLAQNDVYGDPGANGADGDEGDPGTNGGVGENGDNAVAYVYGWQQWNFLNGRGGDGGHGGKGGDGSDGNDVDQTARGGNGGNGGDGGFGVSIWDALNTSGEFAGSYRGQTLTQAFGGIGGNGGMPGIGQGDVFEASGGSGGDGGFARANGVARQSVRVLAQGGWGGMGYGVGNRGGNGGGATAAATLQFDDSLVTQESELRSDVVGGRGGTGQAGADGGQGGNANYGNTFSKFQIDTDRAADVTIRAYGGMGGASFGGAGGNGGLASFDLGYQMANGNFQFSKMRFLNISLAGGNGGSGFLEDAVVGTSSGGRAGGAWMSNDGPLVVDGGSSRFNFSLSGGRGGDSLGSENQANGQNGGRVNFQPLVLAKTGEGQSLRASIDLEGGAGGNAAGTGNGGHGASVSVINPLSIKTSLTAGTTVALTGGDGGLGTVGGDGGDVSVIHTGQATSMPGWTSPIRAEGSFTARAGIGAYGSNHSGRGGDAIVRYEQTAHEYGNVRLSAWGGASQGGVSGDSLATGSLELTSGLFIRGTSLDVFAGRYFVSDFEFKPTVGTNSKAVSLVTSHSEKSFVSRARAFGGFGSLRSGLSRAQATAIGKGAGKAEAEAYSFVSADRDPASNNNAFAISTARNSSLQGSALASSTAEAVGHFNQARSLAIIEAVSGESFSLVRLSVPEVGLLGFRPASLVRGTLAGANGPVEFSTASSLAFRQADFGTETGTAGSFHSIATPHPSAIGGFLSTDPQISQLFSPDPTQEYFSSVVGIGKATIGSDDLELEGGEASVTGSVSMKSYLHPALWDDDVLSLGLFNVHSTGDGFETLNLEVSVGATSIVDESFTSVADAVAWFDGQVVEVIDLSTLEYGMPTLRITWSAQLVDHGSFDFDFVVGKTMLPAAEYARFNSVPEPGAVLLLSVLSTVLAVRRKRHSNSDTQ